jgi:hypothetical protein
MEILLLSCLSRCRLATISELQSQSYVMTDGQSASLSCVKHPSGTQDQIFITVRRQRVCWCGAPSLTRGRVCRVQLLLALASAITLGSVSAGVMTIFYCLRFETPPTWRAKSPYLYLLGTGWPGYTPRHWVPFSWFPTTRRAMVEVWDPTSTSDKSGLSRDLVPAIEPRHGSHRKHSFRQ